MELERERQELLHGDKNAMRSPLSDNFFKVLMEEAGEAAQASDKIEMVGKKSLEQTVPISLIEDTYMSELVQVSTVAMYMYHRASNVIDKYRELGLDDIPVDELYY